MTTTEDIAVLHRIAASLSADLADGGVTAAAIEADVVSPERARSLVQEKEDLEHRLNLAVMASDHNSERADKAEQERDEYRAMHSEQMKTIARLQENPRPLTADDEIVDRFLLAEKKLNLPGGPRKRSVARYILTAALTPPPPRPEGAEGIEALVDAWKLLPESPDCPRPALPDFLAARLIDPTVKES